MGIKRARFNNFRNIEPREMKWSPGLNLLTGENGSGKTNILEGLNIISGWGPLDRGGTKPQLATWESGSSEVQLTGEIDGGAIIRVKIARRCALRLGEKALSASEMRRELPVLTFLPNDTAIIEGAAAARRRLLDMMLALVIPVYAARLAEYRRGVRQKALILKRGMPATIADRALLPLAAWIWKMRGEGVRLLEESLTAAAELAPAPLSLSLSRGGAGLEEDPADDYARSALSNRERELAVKFPLTGPHRDDLLIYAGERPAAESLSRGLRRRSAIALMLAASEGVRRKTGREPVLLLDEAISELDASGRELLFSALLSRGTQVFAATAEPFTQKFPGTIHRVSCGRVEESYENE